MQSNVLEKFSLLRGAFASLQELDLSGNNLTSLPIEIVLSLSHTHTPIIIAVRPRTQLGAQSIKYSTDDVTQKNQ
jgi:Leucine-rich repeat (LRR) protein